MAEHYDIPLAALHFYPMRANGEIAFPAGLPAPLVRSTITAIDWLYWRTTKGVEDAQRRELGLSKATTPARGGWPNAERSRSRPTTSFAFPDWRQNGGADGPLSVR